MSVLFFLFNLLIPILRAVRSRIIDVTVEYKNCLFFLSPQLVNSLYPSLNSLRRKGKTWNISLSWFLLVSFFLFFW